MSQIRAVANKVDNEKVEELEVELASYIKYLIGETQNDQFTLQRENFSQKHELN